jgi:HSP20 family protein
MITLSPLVRRWDPIRELLALGKNFDRWLSNETRGELPANLWTTDNAVTVAVLTPGIARENIDVSIKSNKLVVKAEQKSDDTEGASVTKFERMFTLPFVVDAESVSAKYENGILWVRMERAEADKPRKVTITE